MLRLIAVSLIVTISFAVMMLAIIAAHWRDLPDDAGAIVFQVGYTYLNSSTMSAQNIELLKPSNFWIGEQSDTLLDPYRALERQNANAVACSADGQSLIASFQRFYLLTVKDKTLKPLTVNPLDINGLAWSPDQKQIAYSDADTVPPTIVVANPDGSDPEPILTNEGQVESVAWSSDSREIAFDTYKVRNDSQIEIVDVATHRIRSIFSTELVIYSLSWSPDGQRISFGLGNGVDMDIYTIRPDGSTMTRLTYSNEPNFDPRWSPDGSLISYTAFDSSGDDQLYVMNADGSDSHLIFAAPPNQDVTNLCWLPPQNR